ncbi:MAG: hypothetical protein HXY34_02160 [Candidatus Thorarchaeota archaeon]|nr:hypothetical protein [Candidatus Thorarchaeota archaeon]
MDALQWRRELDRAAEIQRMLISINPSLQEQTDRIVRHLQDVFAELSKAEAELNAASVLKKRKVQQRVEKIGGELQQDFMRAIRDMADLMRKEHREMMTLLPKLQESKPAEAKTLSSIAFPSVAAGDSKDAATLFEFADLFSKKHVSLRMDVLRETKSLLDENKRIVETYERYVTIDRSEVATTISNDDISHLSLQDLLTTEAKLKAERTYLDGRKDEVSRMLGVSLISGIEGLQASVETATRLGLDLPMDFSQKLRVLAREASGATNLTTLVALESQYQAARQQMSNVLRDKIINMKHEITQKIVAGGIPTTADVIPQAPVVSVENMDVAMLLSSYSRMVEWDSQVRLALRDRVEEILEELEIATDAPDDTGIRDVVGTRQFLATSKETLSKADIDTLVALYLKAKTMRDTAKQHVTEVIKQYITRFQELASSADRVLDYAQLSKKAPKVEDLEGGLVYLLQSLGSLRGAVESGVATFRSACLQEIDAIVEDLQTIKPAYAEIFMPIVVDLEDAADRIKKMDDFGQIRLEMKTIKDSIILKAKESLENLRYRLGVKIRLAAAKLMGAGVEIPSEVQEGIAELNSIGVAAETVFTLPQLARKMIELYERKISHTIIERLESEVTRLHTSLTRAREVGVDVDKEVETLADMKTTPPQELEDAADMFDKLMNITVSESLHKKIRARADQAYVQLKGAISIFENKGMSDFVSRLNQLIETVPTQLAKQSKHVYDALDVCLTLANIQEEMVSVIKNMALKDGEVYAKMLRERSQYYTTIERVYEHHPKDFSRLIYDLDRMQAVETSLKGVKLLDEALSLYNELKQLREGWLDKAQKMDTWHKTIPVYMAGFSPSASADIREKFLEDVSKKIRETYSREDISSYLIWAVREIAASMKK